MRYPKLKGKRYIGLVRCSALGQADTSIDDQLVVLAAFAREHEMIHIDNVELAGVSGSLPGNRYDIDQLIDRKRQRDDFDVLLIQDTTRLTRSGPTHGAKLEYELAAAGIKVVFVTDNLPEGDIGDVCRSLLYFSGKQYAKSISMTSARGKMSSLQQGRSTHCNRPPYGIDKLYLSADGRASHIIRNLPDGTQLKLDPETREVIGRFGKNEGRGVPRHYLKQKDEKVVLVPGADEQVAIVRRIFDRHFVDSWGYWRIAKELNDEGVPSQTARLWTQGVIGRMLLNPIFRGMGIANRYSSAIYHMRAPDVPQPVETNTKTLAENRRPPIRTRPRRDWFLRDEPRLAELLDAHVRDLAAVKQEMHLESQAAGHSPKPNKDRHRDSDFVLKSLLVSKQGGHAMTGRNTGRPTSRRRYYAISKAFTTPTSERVLRKMIPAEPIERTVLDLLQFVLTRAPDLCQTIRKAIEREQRSATADRADHTGLIKERGSLERQLEFIIGELDEVGRDAVKKKAVRLQAQIRALDERIEKAGAKSVIPCADIEGAVSAVVEQLHRLSESLDELQKPALRRLLETFVKRVVLDLESRDVELELRLPSWAVNHDAPMCLDTPFAWKRSNEAHPETALLLGLRLMWLPKARTYMGCDFAAAA